MTGLTILRAHEGRRLAKRFEQAAKQGFVTRHDYDKATWFSAESVTVADIHALHRLLLRMEADPGACVIRGEAAPETDRRRTRRNTAAFPETPRTWVMLDVDGMPLPAGCSVLADPADAARTLLDLLSAHAPELEGVAAVVQFSSSAGLDELGEAAAAVGLPNIWRGVAKQGVAAHVWYCLTQPAGEAEIKRWMAPLKAAGLKLDSRLAQSVQAHYTSAPIFNGGLHDPLAGRRTLLIEGDEDAAELVIPAEPERPRYTPGEGPGAAGAGRGYVAYLDEIGGPDGFRAAMLRATSSFVATNWPHPDLEALKADIRARIAAADPGGRPAAVLHEYASDRHLGSLIQWAMTQEGAKRAQQQAEAERPVEPTFPGRGIPLAAAERQAARATREIAMRQQRGEAPEVMLRMTVGGGKSEVAIAATSALLDAAHAGGREGALYYLVPRHDLGGEIVGRIAKAHPGRKVAIWRGMDQPDPEAKGKAMCQDPELPRLAGAAGLSATAACGACPLRLQCGYRRQRGQDAEVWVLAHNAAFNRLPAALPDAAVVVIDEAFWSAGLAGTDGPPVQMAVSALTEQRTGNITGMNRLRLLELRRLMAAALEAMGEGGLTRAGFEALGITAAAAEEWRGLEWMTAPAPGLDKGMDRDAIAERLREAAGSGFNRHRPRLAKFVAALLAGTDARSVNARLIPDADLGRGQGTGPAVRFAWRQDFSEWVAAAPKLILDATTHPEVVRQWLPRVEVVDIEVQAPQQRVRQVADREFGRAFFTQNARNVGRLADLVTVELAEAGDGEVLVIAQQAVEEALADELRRRVADDRLPDGGTGMPARLHLAHHGAITGLDRFGQVARIVVVGRPAMNRRDGERLAEVMQGRAAEVAAEEDSQWPTVVGGIRMADGTGHAVRQPRHPDSQVEALRWSVTEGAVLQAIGRGRGVRRAVQVTLLAALALPLTVAEVLTWDEAAPDRLTLALAEAAINGRALPLAPADLAMARSDLFPTAKAVERYCSERGRTPQTLIGDTYKRLGGPSPHIQARYRKPTARSWSLALVPPIDGRAALEALIGPLSAFEFIPPAAAPAEEPAMPPAKPPEQARVSPEAFGLRPALPHKRGVEPWEDGPEDGMWTPADVLTVASPKGVRRMVLGDRRSGDVYVVPASGPCWTSDDERMARDWLARTRAA
jgi:hypothetical protein